VLRYTNLMRAIETRYLGCWVPDVRGWRVLDVGCGHGFYSLTFPRRDAHLLGCDLSVPALQTATQTAQGMGYGDHAAYLVANGSHLPLPEGAFDLVVCNCVLEHIVDDRGALVGMCRALRPGGLLYLTVDSAEHDLALGFLEHLPAGAKALVLRPEVANAPTVAHGLESHLTDIYDVQRRYHRAELATVLEELGLEVLERRSYLSRLGAVHYEAFHLFRGLDSRRGLGRLAYMVTSLILYPFVVLVDDGEREQGYGLVFVARKGDEPGTRSPSELADLDRDQDG
jgi:SAM-dependent methyltransferase